MNLAIIMHRGSPWARSIAINLAEQGFRVHIVDFEATKKCASGYLSSEDDFQRDDIAELEKRAADVFLLDSRFTSNIRYISCAPAFRRYCKRRQIDVALALSASGFATLAHFSGFRPFVAYAVGSDILLSSGLARIIIRMAMRSAALVLANGRHLAEQTSARAPFAKVKPHLIGVDTSTFCVRKTHGPDVVFLNNRVFGPIYNNEQIIRALSLLPETAPDWKFHFASKGPGLQACQQLADQVMSPATREKVIFHGGVSNGRMLELYAEADVFVSMSRSDGTATSLLEALAASLFPVISDIPQNAEWIAVKTGNGFLVPLDDPTALASALMRLLQNRGIVEEHREFNRSLVLARANAAVKMRELGGILRSINQSLAVLLAYGGHYFL